MNKILVAIPVALLLSGFASKPTEVPFQAVSMQPYYDKIYQRCVEARQKKYGEATHSACERDAKKAITQAKQSYRRAFDEEEIVAACAVKKDAAGCIKDHQQRFYSRAADRFIARVFGRR